MYGATARGGIVKYGKERGKMDGKMLECQSSWSVNIIVRLLLYLAHTWHEHIETTHQNRYGSRKLSLPQTELYVIYTGNRKSRPEWISLSEEFFGGNKDFLEARVKVLYGDRGKKDIISQYVDFTKVSAVKP